MKPIGSIVLLAALGLLAASGCGRKEEAPPLVAASPTPVPAAPAPTVSVVNVTLGRGVDADKKVTAASDTFAPTDTIYASVSTEGVAQAATLLARWTYQDGQTVHEETQALTLTGPATTEFHISKPDGWPKGDYKVEIMVDGVPVRAATFKIA